jgi:hypothetical protein
MLNGHFSGTFQAYSFPDAGKTYYLSGQGYVRPLGATSLTGNVSSLGNILQGQAGGTVTLTNTDGSITIQLTGPVQPGLSPLPRKFAYQVVGGTGTFAGATGTGTATLVLDTETSGPLGELGRFDLSLAGNP